MSNLQSWKIQFWFVIQHEVVSIKSCSKSSDDVFNTRNLLWLSTICLQSDGTSAAFCDFKQTQTVNINWAVGIDGTSTHAKRTTRTAAVLYIPSVFLYVSFWTLSRFISYSEDMRACTTSSWTPAPPARSTGMWMRAWIYEWIKM